VRYIDALVTLGGLEQLMADDHSAKRGGSSLFERLTRADDPVFEQIDRNAKSLLQSALTRLDVVSREEFDAQGRRAQAHSRTAGGAGSANRCP
jgi:BMFP domain-containing protein YqiC